MSWLREVLLTAGLATAGTGVLVTQDGAEKTSWDGDGKIMETTPPRVQVVSKDQKGSDQGSVKSDGVLTETIDTITPSLVVDPLGLEPAVSSSSGTEQKVSQETTVQFIEVSETSDRAEEKSEKGPQPDRIPTQEAVSLPYPAQERQGLRVLPASMFLAQEGAEKVRTGRVIVFEQGARGAYYIDSLEICSRYQTSGRGEMTSSFTFRSPRHSHLGGHNGSNVAERSAKPSALLNIVMANPNEEAGALMTLWFEGSQCDVYETPVRGSTLIGLAEGETKVIGISNGSPFVVSPETPLYAAIVAQANHYDTKVFDYAGWGKMGPKKVTLVENLTPERQEWLAQEEARKQAEAVARLKATQEKKPQPRKLQPTQKKDIPTQQIIKVYGEKTK